MGNLSEPAQRKGLLLMIRALCVCVCVYESACVCHFMSGFRNQDADSFSFIYLPINI